MMDLIDIAVVEDNRMFIDGLRAWAETEPDIRLAAVTSSVDELLGTAIDDGLVLMNPALRADPDPALNVRRLIGAGHHVLVIDGSADLSMVARILAAGAHGYLTRDHDMAALGDTVRAIASGGTAWSIGPALAAEPDGYPGRPALSEREHDVLMAYVSGLTLESAARRLGISPETAKTYLKRVKAKYRGAGLPVYTKLDLAERVRADCVAGSCRRAVP
jgi:two-component system, NarL family, nitrate/nitrite response regulator NarL